MLLQRCNGLQFTRDNLCPIIIVCDERTESSKVISLRLSDWVEHTRENVVKLFCLLPLCDVSRLPKLNFVALNVHDVNKFTVTVGLDCVYNYDAIFFQVFNK